uniref:A-kinase anchor protein 2 C-terminal domain-containing protein n=1 Tax=Neolamprologus brichardi TaxID=32507 RepID=A0A3Q4I5T7_NEOBR
MATRPTAWQEQCPVNLLDESVNESWARGDNFPLKGLKAPKAEPEEDIDILEPDAQVNTQREKETISKIKTADATKMENEGAARIRETEEAVMGSEQVPKNLSGGLKTQEEPEVELCKEVFPPTPSLGALSSDSGVSADFSPSNTLESSPSTVSRETPIEREIRRSIEREHSLRRSRGLPNLHITPEYVEVPLRKTVLSNSVAVKTEWCQDKDREFAGKKMLHEIQTETQREQDLVKLGKIPGFYDKGTVRQIREKKQIYETFQTPSDSTFTASTSRRAPSVSSVSNGSTPKKQEDISSQVSTTEDTRVEKRHKCVYVRTLEQAKRKVN